MNKKILILGEGFIGKRLKEELNCPICAARIRAFSDAEKIIKRYKPQVVINCIGETGRRNVDDCELDIDGTLLANSFVPVMLAEVALRNNIKLVHISSGCIYNFDYKKDRPIKEEDIPDFFDLFHSRSKIYSERALEVLSRKRDILILRIRVPLSDRPHPKNILDKLIKYKRVIDMENSVTYIPDFVKALKYLLKIDARGIYNLVNKGGLRYPSLMQAYKRYIPSFKYKVVSFQKLGVMRTNLIMSTAKLEKSGFKVRNINSVLEECLKNHLKF
jgi:dTDP-4-dehydrorhamnose reductase